MQKTITRTIFKHLITDSNGLAPDMVNFRNIKVNGEVRGCSGFLKYANGVFIYVNTEESCLATMKNKILYRVAKDEKDFGGGVNHFAVPSFKEKHDYNLQRNLRELAYGKCF